MGDTEEKVGAEEIGQVEEEGELEDSEGMEDVERGDMVNGSTMLERKGGDEEMFSLLTSNNEKTRSLPCN